MVGDLMPRILYEGKGRRRFRGFGVWFWEGLGFGLGVAGFLGCGCINIMRHLLVQIYFNAQK